MTVSVRNHQAVCRPRVPGQPCLDQVIHRLTHRAPCGVVGRAGVEQHRADVAEEQVEKRRLVADRLALTKDDRMLVDAMHLDLRLAAAAARQDTVMPAHVQGSRRYRRVRDEVDLIRLGVGSHPHSFSDGLSTGGGHLP